MIIRTLLGITIGTLIITGSAFAAQTTFTANNNQSPAVQRTDVAECRSSSSGVSSGAEEVSGLIMEDMPSPGNTRVNGSARRSSSSGGRGGAEESGIIIVGGRPGGGAEERGIIIVNGHPVDSDPAFLACMETRGYTQQ